MSGEFLPVTKDVRETITLPGSLGSRQQQTLFGGESIAPDVGRFHAQVDAIAGHVQSQLMAHDQAQKRTAIVFEELLRALEESAVTFQQAFYRRDVPVGNVYAMVDADRSVGILHVLWHCLSFTMRCNTKPLAVRYDTDQPVFVGRIVALLGDYNQKAPALGSQEYPELLEHEVASLYVPATVEQPAMMVYRHQEEQYFLNQLEAAEQFFLRVAAAVCTGGALHETVALGGLTEQSV